ncbi:MAG: ImmA/IrrE family metallo-endopeptidase, partial [Aedoeadaptatus pacaensis]
GKNISGVCYKGASSRVIAVNSRMSLGRQRFSLAHELYHLYFDEAKESQVSRMAIGVGDAIERCADQFASYLLMPSAALSESLDGIKAVRPGAEDVIRLEQYYGLSHKAMLYRLVSDGVLTAQDAGAMETGVMGLAARLGYDTSLYRPTPEEKERMVLGRYLALSEKLLEEECISHGKYEELLMDAFRDDIVFGDLGEEGIPLD